MTTRRWKKSSYSNGQGACLEACSEDGKVGIRDSKLNPNSPELWFSQQEWDVFLAGVRGEEFKRL